MGTRSKIKINVLKGTESYQGNSPGKNIDKIIKKNILGLGLKMEPYELKDWKYYLKHSNYSHDLIV